MKGTEPGPARQLGEIGLLSMMSIQIKDHVCHSFVIIHGRIISSGSGIPTRFLLLFLKLSPSGEMYQRLSRSAQPYDLFELALQRAVRFVIVLVAPDR